MNILYDASFVLAHVSDVRETGIFRVEKAWLHHLSTLRPEDDINIHYLICHGRNAYILDAAQGRHLINILAGTTTVSGFLPQLAQKIGRKRRAIKLDIPRRAITSIKAYKRRGHISKALKNLFPTGGWYVSAGMTVKSTDFMIDIKNAGLRTASMLHDTIPLDMPHFCYDGARKDLLPNITFNALHGDALLCNSQATADDFQRHAIAITGSAHAQPIVAHLGIEQPPRLDKAIAALPHPLRSNRAVFMILGTIEPRKNHGFLLDLWEDMARTTAESDMPQLVIAGRWGWKIDEFRTRVNASPELNKSVFIFEGPDDNTVGALLDHCNALLMPSLAEGFGLPVIEAAQKGIPVLVNDLPIYREIAGSYPVLLPLEDPLKWIERLKHFATEKVRLASPPIMTWDQHCTTILDGLRNFSSSIDQ